MKARTKVDASKRIVNLINDAENGVAPADGNATVAQLLDLWRERCCRTASSRPSSLDNYDRALRMLGARVRPRAGCARLDVERIERGLDRLATGTVGPSRGKPLSRRSLKLFRSTLAQVLDLGVRRKLIAGNPARIAELTPTAARTKPRRSLTAAEAETLWAALEHERLGNLFRLMLVTGLRPGEALGLCWDAVDLDAGLLHVRRPYAANAAGPCSSTRSRRRAPGARSDCPGLPSTCCAPSAAPSPR